MSEKKTNVKLIISKKFANVGKAMCQWVDLIQIIIASLVRKVKIPTASDADIKLQSNRQLTESTEAITDTTHITRPIFQLKTGVPHCNGYGNLNQGEDLKACDVSTRQDFILNTCFRQKADTLFEAGIFASQPL